MEKLKPRLEQALKTFNGTNQRRGEVIYEDPSFTLEVFPASKKFENFYLLGAMQDLQAGGWVVAEFLKNIEHCIRAKTERLKACAVKYQAYWLVLVNTSGLRLDQDDRDVLLAHIFLPVEWNRVLILNTGVGEDWFELCSMKDHDTITTR